MKCSTGRGSGGRTSPPKIIVEDQRGGASPGDSKGPKLEPSGAKRRTDSGQNIDGQKQSKRTKFDPQENPRSMQEEEEKERRFISKKSKVPRVMREELVERERAKELGGSREQDTMEDHQGETRNNPCLSVDPGRPL